MTVNRRKENEKNKLKSMYSIEDLERITKIRQSLRGHYKNRREIRHQLYRHGVWLRLHIGKLIVIGPLLIEIYFVKTFGFSLFMTLPIYYFYWKSKTKLCNDMNRKADEIRFSIVKLETGLRKNHSLVYESYEDFLYNPENRRRFCVKSNVLFDDVFKDVREREIDEDWF